MSDAITRGDAASRYERTIDAQPDMAWALISRAIKFARRSVRPGLEEFSGRPEGAIEFADLNAKRALLGACLREMPDRSLRSTLEHLGRLEPDLAALLDLVAA